MSGQVEALAEALGDIRVAEARTADWWTNDEDHRLLAQVLRGECATWAAGLLASDWLRDHDRALRESIAADIEARRIFCPVHQIPDCSPMLNGCSLVIHVTTWRDNLARKVARGEQS